MTRRRSLLKAIAAGFVGVWTFKPSTATPTPQPRFEPLQQPSARDQLLMDAMRRLYAEHVEFCALRGHKPFMQDPEKLFAVAANLRSLHDLDAVEELYYAWVRELNRHREMVLAAERRPLA